MHARGRCEVLPDGSGGTSGTSGGGGSGGTSGTSGTGGVAGMAGVGGAMSMEIDDAINMLGRYTPDAMQTVEVDAPNGAPVEDRCGAVRYWERTTRFTSIGVESTHGPELFPGNVVNGDDAILGRLSRVNAPLAPVTFSVSLQNTDNVRGELPTPSLISFREERNRLLSDAMSAVAPAQVAFRIASVNTSEELSTALGTRWVMRPSRSACWKPSSAFASTPVPSPCKAASMRPEEAWNPARSIRPDRPARPSPTRGPSEKPVV